MRPSRVGLQRPLARRQAASSRGTRSAVATTKRTTGQLEHRQLRTQGSKHAETVPISRHVAHRLQIPETPAILGDGGTNTWRERLLLCWILVPVLFFDLWPTKGFQYLLPIAPPFAVLAARTLTRWHPGNDIHLLGRHLNFAVVNGLIIALMVITLLVPSLQAIQPATTGTFIAGTGGVPGGREAGEWVRDHIPTGATLLTIGPSMANILEFYGYRQAYGLSISPNPLRRNPSYQAIINPDLQIRNGDLQYVVWDSYSAERSSFFSNGLLKFTKRYNGRIIYVESVMVPSASGTPVAKPVIIIYEVRP